MNILFEAIEKESAPMYDAAIITEDGVEYWKNPCSHNANNSHSATKLVVATCIGILCDRGLLSLNTPVASLFAPDEKPDDMDEAWNIVTVRDCLTHKTGIEVIPYGVDEDEHIALIGEDYLRYVFSLKIMHEPGTYRHYSDATYYLLCRVIHKASGMTADEFMKRELFDVFHFRQWAIAKCPKGHPIGGGGFFCRSDDLAKLGYMYACDGMYEGRRILSPEWIAEAMSSDYALSAFRDTDIYLKTGARGQLVGFSMERKAAVSWHGCSEPTDNGKRNDRLLEAFSAYLDEKFGRRE